MGLRLLSLSSGSRGNCVLVSSDTASLIIDAGISVPDITKGLKAIDAPKPSVLVTHCHYDHIARLGALTKKLTPDTYCHTTAHFSVNRHIKGGRVIPVENDFFVGDLTVSPFTVSHDTPCCGYSVYHQGRKITVVTDLGCVTEKVSNALMGSDLVFIEANHDEELLLENQAYPRQLKNRILSARGHLSNTACGNALRDVVRGGTKQIILGHLSQENNYPELAHSTVSRILKESGAREGVDFRIEVVTFGKMSGIFEIS